MQREIVGICITNLGFVQRIRREFWGFFCILKTNKQVRLFENAKREGLRVGDPLFVNNNYGFCCWKLEKINAFESFCRDF